MAPAIAFKEKRQQMSPAWLYEVFISEHASIQSVEYYKNIRHSGVAIANIFKLHLCFRNMSLTVIVFRIAYIMSNLFCLSYTMVAII